MSTLWDLLLWIVGCVGLGLILRMHDRHKPARSQTARDGRRVLVGKPAVLFYISLGLFVATVALSGVLTARLRLTPLMAHFYLFVGIGLLISFALPLVLSRAFSKQHYEDYWVYMTEGSRVIRKSIVWIVVGAALIMLAAGGTMLISNDT